MAHRGKIFTLSKTIFITLIANCYKDCSFEVKTVPLKLNISRMHYLYNLITLSIAL